MHPAAHHLPFRIQPPRLGSKLHGGRAQQLGLPVETDQLHRLAAHNHSFGGGNLASQTHHLVDQRLMAQNADTFACLKVAYHGQALPRQQAQHIFGPGLRTQLFARGIPEQHLIGVGRVASAFQMHQVATVLTLFQGQLIHPSLFVLHIADFLA